MLMFIKYLALAEKVMYLQEVGEIVRSVEDMAEGTLVRTDKQTVFQMLSTFSVKFASNISPTLLVLYHYLAHIT